MTKYFAVSAGLLSALFSVFAVFGRPQSGSLEALMVSVFFGVVAAVLARAGEEIDSIKSYYEDLRAQEHKLVADILERQIDQEISKATVSLKEDLDKTREHVVSVDKAITMLHNANRGF